MPNLQLLPLNKEGKTMSAFTWEEYLAEKQKLVDRQIQASAQKSPASRLVWFHSASFPNWHVQVNEVRELDELFENNDFDGVNNLLIFTYNYLFRSVIDDIKNEIALRLAVKEGKLEPEKYQPAWWVK